MNTAFIVYDKNVEKANFCEDGVRIDKLRIYVAEAELGGRAYNPRILWTRKQAVLIEVVDSDGVCGWGECWTFDQSADALVRFIQTEVRPAVLGRDVPSIEGVWQEVWSNSVLSGRHGMTAAALSGLDCALWDILAKRQGISTGEAMSRGAPRRPVPVYASGGLYLKGGGLAELQAEMRGHKLEGYRCVKMKIGALDFDQDLERVRAVREAVGRETGLIVDAVYSLDRAAAERWLPEWHALGVEAVQAPFAARDWDSMQWLNRDCGMPVMVFEAESRYVIFRALLERQAIGVLQFSPIAVGGVTASLALIELAERFGCQTSLQCSSTWLAEMIALQIACVNPSVRHVEMHRFHTMLFEYAEPAHRRLKAGCVELGDTQGVGFAVPQSCVREFEVGLPDLATNSKSFYI